MGNITQHVMDAIKHAAEMLCSAKLEATQDLYEEVTRFRALLFQLDVINDDQGTFDSILNYLISEIGIVNTETILWVIYRDQYNKIVKLGDVNRRLRWNQPPIDVASEIEKNFF